MHTKAGELVGLVSLSVFAKTEDSDPFFTSVPEVTPPWRPVPYLDY